MSSADDLFELRNYFHLGNYQAALTEGATVHTSDQATQIERDVVLARIQIAQGNYDSILTSINEGSHVSLQAVALLASLLKDESVRPSVTSKLTAWLDDEISMSSTCMSLICALIYAVLGDYDNALRVASRERTLEHSALKVQVLLKMNRADVAEKEVSQMQEIDEDATLTQLATAWLHLTKGGPNAQEAVYIYQDLLERHGATDPILNGIAASHLASGNAEEAERVLQEALSKNPNFPVTLINVTSCAQFKNKPLELVSRYVQRLTEVSPACAWLTEMTEKRNEFDSLAARVVS